MLARLIKEIALIAALTARGHDLRPAKVGPDYIDAAFLAAAAGRAAVNLDRQRVCNPDLGCGSVAGFGRAGAGNGVDLTLELRVCMSRR